MKTTVTIPIPDLKSDAGYALAFDKLAELQSRATDLERRRSQAVEGNTRRLAVLTARAEALLEDDAVPFSGGDEEARHREDLNAVADELAVTRRAIDLQQVIVEARAPARVARGVPVSLGTDGYKGGDIGVRHVRRRE